MKNKTQLLLISACMISGVGLSSTNQNESKSASTYYNEGLTESDQENNSGVTTLTNSGVTTPIASQDTINSFNVDSSSSNDSNYFRNPFAIIGKFVVDSLKPKLQPMTPKAIEAPSATQNSADTLKSIPQTQETRNAANEPFSEKSQYTKLTASEKHIKNLFATEESLSAQASNQPFINKTQIEQTVALLENYVFITKFKALFLTTLNDFSSRNYKKDTFANAITAQWQQETEILKALTEKDFQTANQLTIDNVLDQTKEMSVKEKQRLITALDIELKTLRDRMPNQVSVEKVQIASGDYNKLAINLNTKSGRLAYKILDKMKTMEQIKKLLIDQIAYDKAKIVLNSEENIQKRIKKYQDNYKMSYKNAKAMEEKYRSGLIDKELIKKLIADRVFIDYVDSVAARFYARLKEIHPKLISLEFFSQINNSIFFNKSSEIKVTGDPKQDQKINKELKSLIETTRSYLLSKHGSIVRQADRDAQNIVRLNNQTISTTVPSLNIKPKDVATNQTQLRQNEARNKSRITGTMLRNTEEKMKKEAIKRYKKKEVKSLKPWH